MAVTLDELEKRLAQVEEEIARWREIRKNMLLNDVPSERGARLFRESLLQQGEMADEWTKVMKVMGISGTPVSAEELQKMIVPAHNNELSQTIIDMREE